VGILVISDPSPTKLPQVIIPDTFTTSAVIILFELTESPLVNKVLSGDLIILTFICDIIPLYTITNVLAAPTVTVAPELTVIGPNAP
jgi:hypothetical protein